VIEEPIDDEDAIPATEAAARLHISNIRAEKGLDGPESNSADLQAALIVYVCEAADRMTRAIDVSVASQSNCIRNLRTFCWSWSKMRMTIPTTFQRQR
jgi:hypothetical protein